MPCLPVRKPRLSRGTAKVAILASILSGSVASLLAPAASGAAFVFSGTGASGAFSTGFSPALTVGGATDTTLTFNGVFAGATTQVINNDLAGTFTLNAMGFTESSPANTASTVTLTGNALQFSANGGTNPVITTNATRTTVNISNTITLNATLTSAATTALTLSGAIGGTGGITKNGASTLTISGTSNSYAGTTTVNAGAFAITGSVANSTSYIMTGGGLLLADNSANTNFNQIRDDATISLASGGEFQFKGNATGATGETVGSITLGEGTSIISGTSSGAGGPTTALTVGSLSRSNSTATLLLRTTSGGGTGNVSRLQLSTPLNATDARTTFGLIGDTVPSTGDSGTNKTLAIIPWAIGDTSSTSNGATLVTYDTGSGFRSLSLANESLPLTAGYTTASLPENVRVNAAATLTASAITINSLVSGSALTLNGTNTNLTINSGVILSGGGSSVIGAGFSKITLGGGTGYVTTPASRDMIIAAPLDVTSGGGLVKSGTSFLYLTGSQLYTGQTTINQGILQFGIGGSTGDLGSNSAPIVMTTGSATSPLNFIRNNDFTLNNAIVGSKAVVKQGAGTLTQLGSSQNFTGDLTSRYGRLTFDLTNAASSSTNYALGATAGLRMESGSFEFKAKAGAGNSGTQLLGSLIAGGGLGLNTLVINKNGSDSFQVNLTAGALTLGSYANIFVDSSSGGIFAYATTTATGTNQLLIKDSTGRIDFGVTSGVATYKPLVALTATTPLPTSSTGATAYALAGSQTLTGDASGANLRISTTGAGQSLNVGTSKLSLSTLGNLLFTGSDDYLITGSTGSITGSSQTSIAHFGTGKLTLAATIGSTSSPTSNTIFLGNNSLLDWTGGTLYTPSGSNASVQISGLTVRLSNSFGITNSTTQAANNNGIVLTGGGILELNSGNLTRSLGSATAGVTSAGLVSLAGNGGFSAFGADRFVNLGGASAGVTWSSGGFLADGATLILGSDYSNKTLDFQNPIALGNTERVIETRNGVASNDVDAKLSGVLSGAGGGIVKTGAGTLQLSAASANTFTGSTTVKAGVLHAAAAGSLNATSSISVTSGTLLLGPTSGTNANGLVKDTATVALSGGTLKVADNQSGFTETVGALTLSSNSTIDFGIGSSGNANGNTLFFSSLASFNGTLAIYGWSGTAYTLNTTTDSGSDLMQDRLVFGTLDTGLYPVGSVIPGISFYADGNAPIGGGMVVAYNGGYEIVAIPEPSTLLSLLSIAGLVGFRERRRVRSWFRG